MQMGKEKKKKHKSKKSKKEKKEKKEKKRKDSSSDSSSSSSDNRNWTESGQAASNRQDWMSGLSSQMMESGMFLGSVTSSKIRAAEKERQAASEAVEVPAGLQQQQQQLKTTAPAPCKSDWYRRAYRRCAEQAEDEGRSLEEVAAERWGSLDRLRQLMKDASREGSRLQHWQEQSMEAKRWRRQSPTESKPHSRRSPPPASTSNSASSSASWQQQAPDRKNSNSAQQSTESSIMIEEERYVNNNDINALSAQVLKAQLDSDTNKAAKLQRRLDVMLEAKRRNLKVKIKQKVSRAEAEKRQQQGASQQEKRGDKVREKEEQQEVSELGEASTIAEMRARERLVNSNDMQMDFINSYRGKLARNADSEENFGEYEEAGASRTTAGSSSKQLDSAASRDRALAAHKFRASGRKCDRCLSNLQSNLIVHSTQRVCLYLPNCRSLTERHCLLTSVDHVPCSAQLDEAAFNDVRQLKRQLTERLLADDLDCVFIELAKGFNRYPHLLIEVFPLPKSVGESAPIYFRKAMQETGSEWAGNKKVMPLRDMDIRRTVPQGFPYFSVEFGQDSGLVRVIEDDSDFPDHFGREIVAGMLQLPHELWRKPKPDNWEKLLHKVSEFRFFWSGSDDLRIQQD